jgi:hypothetical protein
MPLVLRLAQTLGGIATTMPLATPVPEASFLSAYSRRGAYTDCYAASVPGSFGLAALVEAVYTSPLFKLERWILATLLKLPSTDRQARQIAMAQSNSFAAWKVERRSEREVLLNAGQTRLWLCVAATHANQPSTTLLFGSAVVPLRPGGKFGVVFHLLLGFHRLYSKLLLAAAVKRIAATARAQNAA